MAFSPVELKIINLASILLNDTTIDTTSTNTPFAEKASNAFKFTYETAIAASNWRFATVFGTADEQLGEKPEFADFQFKMKLPADLLAVASIIETGGTSDALIWYKMFAKGIIFTNVNKVTVEYRRSVDINKVPDYFVHYMGFQVAHLLAIGYSKIQKAEQIEATLDKALANALFVERQNYPMEAIKSNPLAHNQFGIRGGVFHGNIEGL